MPSTKPEKARIINVDNSNEQPIECLFNPNEYTFSKKNRWNRGEVRGQNVPQLEFGGGDSMTLKMQLFFDTYTTGEDVRQTTDRIWRLMRIDENLQDASARGVREQLKENVRNIEKLLEDTRSQSRQVIQDLDELIKGIKYQKMGGGG